MCSEVQINSLFALPFRPPFPLADAPFHCPSQWSPPGYPQRDTGGRHQAVPQLRDLPPRRHLARAGRCRAGRICVPWPGTVRREELLWGRFFCLGGRGRISGEAAARSGLPSSALTPQRDAASLLFPLLPHSPVLNPHPPLPSPTGLQHRAEPAHRGTGGHRRTARPGGHCGHPRMDGQPSRGEGGNCGSGTGQLVLRRRPVWRQIPSLLPP